MGDIWNMMSDKLGFGDYDSPVGMKVKTATTPDLPRDGDFARSMEVVDAVNKNSDGVNQLEKALVKQLKSDHAQVVSLTLRLCNMVIRNCGPPVYKALGRRAFLEHIEALTIGSLGFTVRDQALCLIQEWGLTFIDSPTFFYAPMYRKIQSKGVKFPLDESVASANLIAIAGISQPRSKMKPPKSSSVTKAVQFRPTEEELAKMDGDLDTVEQQITLCNETVQNFQCVGEDEVQRLSEVVGFLEACKPRMEAIIEAGMRMGALTPQLMERCLQINDQLISALDAERKASLIEKGSEWGLKFEQKEEEQHTNMNDGDEKKDFPSNELPPDVHEIEEEQLSDHLLDVLGDSTGSSQH